jgi:chromosome segregation ATPase
MNLNDLKVKHPAKFAEFERAQQELEAARAQVTPHNHECGVLWAEVEKAQAAYQAKREETAALERKVRLPQLASKLADLARAITGM